MIKRIIVAGLCVVFLTVATSAFAEGVFITKNGKKYHMTECPLIRNKKPQEISMKDALEKGLKPCGKCFKDSAAVGSGKTEKLAASKKKEKKVIAE